MDWIDDGYENTGKLGGERKRSFFAAQRDENFTRFADRFYSFLAKFGTFSWFVCSFCWKSRNTRDEMNGFERSPGWTFVGLAFNHFGFLTRTIRLVEYTRNRVHAYGWWNKFSTLLPVLWLIAFVKIQNFVPNVLIFGLWKRNSTIR